MTHEKKTKSKYTKNRSHLILSWVVSYIVIFLIPIIIYLFFTLYTYSVSLKQDADHIKEIIAQKASSFDGNLTDALSYTSSLYIDENVKKISSRTAETFTASDRIYFRKIISTLSDIVNSNNCFSNIYLYYPNIEMVITKDNLYSFDLIPYLTESKTTNLEQLAEIQSFLSAKKEIYISLQQSNNNIIIGQALYTTPSGNLNSFIVYELNTEFFLERLIIDTQNSYMMLANNSQLLLYDQETPENLLTDSISLITEVFHTKDNILPEEYITTSGQKYILTSWVSSLPGLRYIALTNHSRYNQMYFSLISAFLITMLISILFGVIFTIYFIRRNYSPVQKIMEQLAPLPTDSKSKNEYSIILNSIISSSSELEKQRALLSNNYLQKVLSGEIPYNNSFPYKSQLPLHINENGFYISIIKIINEKKQNSDLNLFIIENVLQELLLSHGFHVNYCKFTNSIACIISCKEEASGAEDNILNDHSFLYDFCQSNFDFQFNIGISNKWYKKEHLAQAYTQATDTLEYIHFYNCNPVYAFSAIPTMNNLSTVMVHDAKYMLDMVTHIKKSEIESYFTSLSDKFKTHSITLIEGKNILYYYYQLLSQLRLFMTKRYPAIGFDALDNLESSFLHMPIMDATQMTCEFFLNACDFIQNQKSNNQQLLIINVCHYIENNYFDENLNQTTIADHFHMTPAYLAQKFKTEKGMSIIQYLYSVRIQHSIELLKQNKLNVSEIATTVGFPNSNAFIRIFKQNTGTTPGKYMGIHDF